MWAAISGIIQIIFLILKNKFEKDADKKKAHEELHEQAVEAIKTGNAVKLNVVLNKLRNP